MATARRSTDGWQWFVHRRKRAPSDSEREEEEDVLVVEEGNVEEGRDEYARLGVTYVRSRCVHRVKCTAALALASHHATRASRRMPTNRVTTYLSPTPVFYAPRERRCTNWRGRSNDSYPDEISSRDRESATPSPAFSTFFSISRGEAFTCCQTVNLIQCI